VPETDGSGETVNVPGGGGGGGVAVPCTTAVCGEVADVEPFLFVATTTIRKVEPASPLPAVYDEADAPSGAQAPPEALHRCQEIEKDGEGPSHSP
jgi:hypothetical protein